MRACGALSHKRRRSPGCFQIDATVNVGVLEKLRIGEGFCRVSIRQVNSSEAKCRIPYCFTNGCIHILIRKELMLPNKWDLIPEPRSM